MSKIIINGKSGESLKAYVNGSEMNGVMAGGTRSYARMEPGTAPAPPAGPKYLCFTAQQAGSTVSFVKEGKVDISAPVLYKSTDGNNWTTWDGSTIALPNVNGKVYIYGDNSSFRNGSSSTLIQPTTYWHFAMSGIIAASGDITAMLDMDGVTGFSDTFTFYKMFEGCESLTTPPALPAMGLSAYCYFDMFRGCTSLTTAPELPATDIPRHCYYRMFYGCTSLTTAPPILPGRYVQQYSYTAMFSGCTSLTTAPVISASSIANHGYENMFTNCTSLTTAPALPATTLYDNCYYQMFRGCTSLTTAPALPATTLAAFCYDSMFANCTALTTAPSLPATTLAECCYQAMFRGCTSLTTVPALPATTMADGCYSLMFRYCSSLAEITVSVSNWNGNNAIDWMEGVAVSGIAHTPQDCTIPHPSNSGVPAGWTIDGGYGGGSIYAQSVNIDLSGFGYSGMLNFMGNFEDMTGGIYGDIREVMYNIEIYDDSGNQLCFLSGMLPQYEITGNHFMINGMENVQFQEEVWPPTTMNGTWSATFNVMYTEDYDIHTTTLSDTWTCEVH